MTKEECELNLIFKSYLRSLLWHIIDLKQAIDDSDIEKAKKIINQLIKDTEDSIAD